MGDELITFREEGKPFFRPILESLEDLDRFNLEVIEIKKTIEIKIDEFHSIYGRVNANKINSFYIDVYTPLNERSITFLHEIHHLLLDKNSPYELELWIKIFPDFIKNKIMDFPDNKLVSAFYDVITKRKSILYEPCKYKEWYNKIHEGRFETRFYERVFLENSNLENELWEISRFVTMLREKIYDISSYNISDFLRKHNPKKYSEIELKIQQAYELYEKAK